MGRTREPLSDDPKKAKEQQKRWAIADAKKLSTMLGKAVRGKIARTELEKRKATAVITKVAKRTLASNQYKADVKINRDLASGRPTSIAGAKGGSGGVPRKASPSKVSPRRFDVNGVSQTMRLPLNDFKQLHFLQSQALATIEYNAKNNDGYVVYNWTSEDTATDLNDLDTKIRNFRLSTDETNPFTKKVEPRFRKGEIYGFILGYDPEKPISKGIWLYVKDDKSKEFELATTGVMPSYSSSSSSASSPAVGARVGGMKLKSKGVSPKGTITRNWSASSSSSSSGSGSEA